MQHHCNLGPIDGLKQTKNRLIIKGLFFASVFFTIISILYVSPVSALPTTADGLASPSDNQTTTTQKTIPNAAESAKNVNATVVLTKSSDTIAKTYGSLNIVLINTNNNSVDYKTTTGTVVIGGYGSTVETPATFTGVAAGTYKVCLEDQTLCSEPFTKVDGQVATASQIVLPADKSTQVLAASTTSGDKPSSSCGTIKGIGWILCPVMTFMANTVDAVYSVISDLLTTPNLNMDTSSSENSAYPAWQIMRSIANVAFVIAFLVIIFSQLTNVGISNYGIKKMLPRLIIAAIFVNLSYFICAIAVDLSNIVGASVNNIFDSVGSGIGTPPSLTDMTAAALLDGTVVVGVGAAAVAAGAVSIAPMAVVALVLPGLITAVFAILMVFLVLTLRQAIIILLIVISPLAFVAFILPNTEDWFEDWRELLVKMLLMYPIIAGIFGASALASKIVIVSSPDNAAVQLMGAFISVIPLAITPVVLTAAGGVLNKFGAMVNNPSKGPFDAMRRGASALKDSQKGIADNKAMNDMSTRPNARRSYLRYKAGRKEIDASQNRERTRAEAEYIARATKDNTPILGGGLRDQMTAGGSLGASDRAMANAIGTIGKLKAEEVTAATALISDLSSQETLQLAKGGAVRDFDASKSSSLRAAAMKLAVDSDINNTNELLSQATSGGMDKETQQSFAAALGASTNRPSYVGQGTIAQFNQGLAGKTDEVTGNLINDFSAEKLIKDAINTNVYSPDKMASTSKDEMDIVVKVVQSDIAAPASTISSNKIDQFRANAKATMDNPSYAGRISKQIEQIETISKL